MKMVNKCGYLVNGDIMYVCDVYLEMWIMYIFCGLTLFYCVVVKWSASGVIRLKC